MKRVWIVAALLLVGAASQAGTPTRQAEGNGWAPLPDEIAQVLEAKAEAYRQQARGFSCTERIRRTRYDNDGAGREKSQDYDYLLVTDPNLPGGFRGLRTRPGSSGRRERRVDLPFPDPYLWSQIFSPTVRSTLRFQVGQWHTTPWKLAIPLSWISSAPAGEGKRITEWSGVAEVEYRTGNVLKVVARPNFQEDRILAELERFLTAFRVLGFSVAPPPEGLEMEVDFGFEHDGLTYPTRVELRTFRQVHRGQRRITSRRVVEYRDYRFFGTRVRVEVPPFTYRPSPPDIE